MGTIGLPIISVTYIPTEAKLNVHLLRPDLPTMTILLICLKLLLF